MASLPASVLYAATNAAYWQAARAMCSRCAEGLPVIKLPYTDGTIELIHQVSYKFGMAEENCPAAPIHALIERLNEVNNETT